MYRYIFVSDYFTSDFLGGAELTTEAIIEPKKSEVFHIKSPEVTENFIENNKDKIWIFGNFYNVPMNSILLFIKMKINYSIIEYDYKLCKFRSIEKHQKLNGNCNCIEEKYGKLMFLFFKNAKKTWFMSKIQRNFYLSQKAVNSEDSEILSSVFSPDILSKIKNLYSDKNNKKNDNFLILNSNSWIKGTEEAIGYAKNNNLKYELVSGLTNEQILRKLALSKGLIFLPRGKDTCPRIVIEAKLLNCELILNENVLHKDEEWFANKKTEEIFDYLLNRADFFWKYYEK